MNTESVACRRVKFAAEDEGMKGPGDFCFDHDFTHIYVWLPGVSGPDAIQIQRGKPGGHRVWGWDGNEDKPTLTPSINATGQWHGWMRAGRLESC
jgi:hypothetical protein